MPRITQDLKYGFRTLRNSPLVSGAAIVALALGIGANTAMFSVVYNVLLRPLPYTEGSRLIVFGSSVPDYEDVKQQTTSIEASAIWASNRYTMRGSQNSVEVLGATVSQEFFPLLSQRTRIGRTLAPSDQDGFAAVISEGFWRKQFAADPAVLGKTLQLNDKVYTVVGVMPSDFAYPSRDFKVWVPFASAMRDSPAQFINRQLRIFRVVARLFPGQTLMQARTQMNVLAERLERDYPKTNTQFRFRPATLMQTIVGDATPVLWMLLGAVGLVLFIACANVANLLLARTMGRAREMAIRTALGATRAHLVQQLFVEALLLSAIGTAFAIFIAYWTISALRAFNPGNLPRMESVTISGPVLWFSIAAGVASGIFFGLAPAAQAAAVNLLDSLKESGNSLSGSRRAAHLRRGLVVLQFAICFVVLLGAALLAKSFQRLLQADPGFKPEHVLVAPLNLAQIKDHEQRVQVLSSVREKIAKLPGITSVGGGSGLPPETAQRGTAYEAEGQTGRDRFAYFLVITPKYFQTLGTRLIAGREFNDADDSRSLKVTVINERLANRLFPDGKATGRRLKLINPDQSDEWREIVGVVQEVRYQGLDDESDAQIYTPIAQTPFPWTYLMIRSSGSGPDFKTVTNAIESVRSDLLPGQIRRMEDLVAGTIAQPRFNMLLLANFAGLALVLAFLGIYSVMSYTVVQRTREIGIRIALGASRARVLRMILWDAVRMIAVALAIGVLIAFNSSRMIESMLYKVTRNDLSTYLAVACLLVLAAIGATFFPACRAANVDPMVALRYE